MLPTFTTCSVVHPSHTDHLTQPERLSSRRPIILDESYASPETAAFHEDGYEGALVAREGSPKEFLSMSAYGKPQPVQIHGYDSGRTYQDGAYTFGTPGYSSQSSAPASSTVSTYQPATQMPPIAYAQGPNRSPYDEQSGPYLNVGSQIPEVTSYSPGRGVGGIKIYVNVTSLYELTTSNSPVFFLMFGARKCPATLAKVGQQGGVCQYTVTAEVPQFASTGWSTPQVALSMFMESEDGDVIGKVDVGQFFYTGSGSQGGEEGAQGASRKRKYSDQSAELMKSPAKRTSSQHLKTKEEYGAYTYGSAEGTAYSPYMQGGNTYTNLMPQQYGRAASAYQGAPSSRHLTPYGYPSTSTASPPTIKAQSPQVSNWNPAYSTVNSSMGRSPGLPSNAGISRSALSSVPSPQVAANPTLIRTSTLQQTPSPGTTPHGGHPGQQFNAYALYPHKAKLEINGDLDSMAQKWTEEEWETKRRLVQFRRSQSGSTISTTFAPVSLDDRPPNSVCVSCIYWEEKQECFVTSVDTIYLLEQLVDARFTVEEKNRIRRNLEGFRPLTVSKGKVDSEEFFKVIMAFPTPKPRNIEKDVKVFHWKDLASALKKIISKYSASPSSTLPPAPPLLTPVSSTEGSATGNVYASDHHGIGSPRSLSGSSTAYTTNIPARVLSPPTQKSMGMQSGPSDLRVPLPQHPQETTSHWPGAQHHMATMQQQYPHFGGQVARNSWDQLTYLESGPPTITSASSPATVSYDNTRPTESSATAGGNDSRISRTSSSSNLPSQQMSR